MKHVLLAVCAALAIAATPNVPPEKELPAMRPVGRTFFATAPQEAVAFMVTYLGATQVSQNVSSDIACAEAAAVSFAGATWTFVHDKRKGYGAVSGARMVQVVGDEMKRVAGHQENYSWWEDTHPGFDNAALKVPASQLTASNLSWQYYVNSDDSERAILRILIPSTMWTLELNRLSDEDKRELLPHAWPTYGNKDPDQLGCRNNSLTNITDSELCPDQSKPCWWKATFAAADPDAAAAFVVKYLGAEQVTSPFPSPKQEGCLYVTWTLFKEAKFMMHFVQSDSVFSGGDVSPRVYAKDVVALREKFPQDFDQHAYNHVTLWVDDLDPIVKNLGDLPFVAKRWTSTTSGSDVAGIFLTVPNNGITIEVRSNADKLTSVAAKEFDVCEVEATEEHVLHV
jgi:catechol 2,3-dioxygenase-like lactoylglutathione lyase family enzyme